jgi:D-alanyl-D-alanine carboxypeptidase/D-alanyl-D-alanine-endopeptidase (penicillin-binding protein 4)
LATFLVAGWPHDVAAQAARKPAPTSRTLAWSSPVGAAQLGAALASLIARAVKSGQWGVLVVSLSQGDTLFDLNADTALAPASTMKVFTSAAALDYLGPTYQFETQALREGDVDSLGVLRGDLVLRGAGDPLLGAHDGENPLRILAHSVAEAGVKQVTGTVVGDGSAFESRRVPDGWLERNLSTRFARRVSALSYNQNVVSVTVRVVNGKARVELYPSISGLPVSSGVTVRADSKGGSVSIRQSGTTGAFYVSGWIGENSPARGNSVNIENPELFAAAAFREALTAEGIKVTGTRVAARTASDSAARIAGLPSKPLADLVAQMNGESNNHFAELLFRNVARTTGTIGSADTGNAIMHSFLADKVGTPASDFFMADGSGLSTLDRVTPRNLVSVLGFAAKAAWATAFSASLPIAGESETLRSRMRGAPAQGRLRAKTGTTGLVISLGGYVTAADGEELAFAFIYNGTERTRARQAIDAMGSTLASFTR